MREIETESARHPECAPQTDIRAPRTLLARKARASLVGRCVVPVHSLLWQTVPQGRFEVELTMLSTFAVILRSGRVLSVTTLLFIIAVTPAASQQGDPVAIQKQFNELYAAGNYPAALVFNGAAIPFARDREANRACAADQDGT